MASKVSSVTASGAVDGGKPSVQVYMVERLNKALYYFVMHKVEDSSESLLRDKQSSQSNNATEKL